MTRHECAMSVCVRTIGVLALGLAASACATTGTAPVEPATPAPTETAASSTGGTVWTGVYSEAQAERGWPTYREQCAFCHSETMTGGPGAPGVVGPGFLLNWDGKTVAELFDYMKAMMPPGVAGSLTDQQYVDLAAVILQGNEFPPGSGELRADLDALGAIQITEARP